MEKRDFIQKIDEQINKLQEAKRELQENEDFTEAEKQYLSQMTQPKQIEKIEGLSEAETEFINNLKTNNYAKSDKF